MAESGSAAITFETSFIGSSCETDSSLMSTFSVARNFVQSMFGTSFCRPLTGILW